MKKVKKNGKLLFFEKQDNDKLIYEQKKVHVFMLYFIDVNQGKEYTNPCRREIEKYGGKRYEKACFSDYGSRNGKQIWRLKQIDPVDEDGHIIIDFSIYDAKRAGFEKVVFIIRREHEEDFRKSIGDRVSKFMEVE